jgi:hypothetical protein
MNLREWKSWLVIGGALIALFAILTFAQSLGRDEEAAPVAPLTNARAARLAQTPLYTGVQPVNMDRLVPQSGTYSSRRNIFEFYEPPPPPPPPPPKPVPPPDRDRDGIPDVQDNCPDVANADQTDIDRNGIGAACQGSQEVPPPPPPPTPPAFPYKLIGTFGTQSRQIASFTSGDEIVNVRVGQTFGNNRFTLVAIGLESADITYVGFPPDVRLRVPVGP